MSQYAAYHRDPRKAHTHFVGVPMVLWTVVSLLLRPLLWPAQMQAGIPDGR